MKFQRIIVTLFFLIPLQIFVQENGTNKGEVIDKLTRQVVPLPVLKSSILQKAVWSTVCGIFIFQILKKELTP
ncbi:hypothetical protein CLV51_11181 [Chitinophaga niastensis]|uniref:Uncharacterized protein n=1 Tax=Chitinophaga niastensis TaxID=536980 RepID=A0A2P8H8Y7_CHINA|nr:hypothetical protein [Chitinophaga niastensis]PSL42695.1 hypothetical protein CLV51_11181 [Chitinophaga niastensis]